MEKESKSKSDKQKFDKMKSFSGINKGKLFIKYDCFNVYLNCVREREREREREKEKERER